MTKLEYILPGRDTVAPHSSRHSSHRTAAAVGVETDAHDVVRLMERIGQARIVVLEEPAESTAASHALRARITRMLITEMGFNVIAVDCDWPDAARVDHYIRHAAYPAATPAPFTRGPVRLWRGAETRGAMDWLRDHNAGLCLQARVAVHGLDLYSHARAKQVVLNYLKRHDSAAAAIARERYAQIDAVSADKLPLKLGIHECSVRQALHEHLAETRRAAEHDGVRFLDTAQAARLMANASTVYRAMYYGLPDVSAQRDTHMFEVLQALLRYYGPEHKVIVWAQAPTRNSDAGDEELSPSDITHPSLGPLCADAYGDIACRVSAAA